MLQLCLLRNADESPRTTSTVLDGVGSDFIVDLSMETRDVLIDDMYFVLGIASYHASLFFQGVAAEDGGLALFDDKFVDFCRGGGSSLFFDFLFWFGCALARGIVAPETSLFKAFSIEEEVVVALDALFDP